MVMPDSVLVILYLSLERRDEQPSWHRRFPPIPRNCTALELCHHPKPPPSLPVPSAELFLHHHHIRFLTQPSCRHPSPSSLTLPRPTRCLARILGSSQVISSCHSLQRPTLPSFSQHQTNPPAPGASSDHSASFSLHSPSTAHPNLLALASCRVLTLNGSFSLSRVTPRALLFWTCIRQTQAVFVPHSNKPSSPALLQASDSQLRQAAVPLYS